MTCLDCGRELETPDWEPIIFRGEHAAVCSVCIDECERNNEFCMLHYAHAPFYIDCEHRVRYRTFKPIIDTVSSADITDHDIVSALRRVE